MTQVIYCTALLVPLKIPSPYDCGSGTLQIAAAQERRQETAQQVLTRLRGHAAYRASSDERK